ncbi:YggS family pyridoxal phosphate-dependent enzyme [Flaviaesturariibacter flavus]|uniref:Pyridoxal phosphate homeostasis protein n=1 Tax=Flaviaesturariibacter flavus TaxID=2502780 RepID=A0A4R1BNR7_9BACT|nr:YggS family pyridoxal phosphate-dependent enzyme [Flaviaesturariibacter flavus]TCJ19121.1 YggS family pyridoxal phosphate-dependent enzyme [Flaviaesturariibacter flavus]
MAINVAAYNLIREELAESGATLVAVSKTKPASDIQALYGLGQRDFGENYVQELVDKVPQLPQDIRWHFIGHLQSNKVKYIVPFVHLIHGIDSEKLLREVSKQAVKNNRNIDVLLQVHIAQEETKFGLDAGELGGLLNNFEAEPLPGVRIRGLMGMASFSGNKDVVGAEFRYLRSLFDQHAARTSEGLLFDLLSMGMSGDYQLALAAGSNLVRIGSLLFGARN